MLHPHARQALRRQKHARNAGRSGHSGRNSAHPLQSDRRQALGRAPAGCGSPRGKTESHWRCHRSRGLSGLSLRPGRRGPLRHVRSHHSSTDRHHRSHPLAGTSRNPVQDFPLRGFLCGPFCPPRPCRCSDPRFRHPAPLGGNRQAMGGQDTSLVRLPSACRRLMAAHRGHAHVRGTKARGHSRRHAHRSLHHPLSAEHLAQNQ